MKILAAQVGGADGAKVARARFVEALGDVAASPETVELAALLMCAYPALAHGILARPRDVVFIARGMRQPRDGRSYRRALLVMVPDLSDGPAVRRALRVFCNREKLRIAARELTPQTGSDVDVTARELSHLADTCTEVALSEALAWADARYGVPTDTTGARVGFSVIGMGKLGGHELNAGSDIDLLLFYATDDGDVIKDGRVADASLHEYFTRVAQRMTSTIEDVTEDGFVWRVDLRLRPEGSKGPLVNALAAAERYYETWGRTWERAALVRARPIAGDLEFGARLLEAIWPFVWRRAVNPTIADEMAALLARARTEAGPEVVRDLKLGPGGIREVEFFAQSLQLVWGGKEPIVRSTNTLDALRRLRARGYVTDREGREMADAYMTLRRLEHRVQFATGLQTHMLPESGDLLTRIARSLGFATETALLEDLERTQVRVAARFASLTRDGGIDSQVGTALERLFIALEAGDEAPVAAWLKLRLGPQASPDLARHLIALSRRPDAVLGAITRDRHPELAPAILDALFDSADPEQATRLMAALFERLRSPTVYTRALAEDLEIARRLSSLFGASAFLGEAMVGHPELMDGLIFSRSAPTAASARESVEEEVRELGDYNRDVWAFTGALRRAKARVTMHVGLADLAGDLGTRDATLVLSALADATLDLACTFAMSELGVSGLATLAMGKLGGREIGYGSDLDIFFVYDPKGGDDDPERYIRAAQRVLRLVGTLHDDGPGYELDTRLRPSGNQGLLVVSLEGFARYHDGDKALAWERQALLKARFCAGDVRVGEKARDLAQTVAYERGAPPPEELDRVRRRMERELGRERQGRYDLKVGRGGIADVEFAVQWLQMKHGKDSRLRTTETETALVALEACGYLDAPIASALREGYRFLRRLEQRLRVLHGTSTQLLEDGAPGLVPLARRMGMRDGPRGPAAAALITRYLSVTRDVRGAYARVLGLSGAFSDEAEEEEA